MLKLLQWFKKSSYFSNFQVFYNQQNGNRKTLAIIFFILIICNMKATLEVSGMTCAACASRIERGLSKLSGVDKANVNFAIETASVEFSNENTNIENIIKKVQALGYDAKIKSDRANSDSKESEVNKQFKLLLLSILLSIPLLYTMVAHFSFTSFLPIPDFILNPWFQLILATPIQFFIGSRFYIGAFKSLKSRSANMDVLVVLGTSAAYFYSLYQIFIHLNDLSSAQLYFETSAILITLILLGKQLETRAKSHTSKAIQTLVKLRPKTAKVVRDGKELEIPTQDVAKEDIVSIKPGDKIPVDGVVVSGTSYVNESMLTGESIPQEKKEGSNVIGGTINGLGFLKIRAAKVGEETVLSEIIRIVENAQGSKAPIQRIADKVSGVFVPIVVGVSFLTFCVWFFWLEPQNFVGALEKTVAVLVIACPCALGLATPTSIMAASGRAAESGILFKGGDFLESTRNVNSIVLDKTGTITKGNLEVTDLEVFGYDEKEFLTLVSSVEQMSEHPIAKAIVTGIQKKGIIESIPIRNFESKTGFGVTAKIEENVIQIGNQKLMLESQIDISLAKETVDQLESNGKTVVIVGIDNQLIGIIGVSDTIKESSKQAVQELTSMGIEITMLTGDNQRVANTIAKEVGIKNVVAEVLPTEKEKLIKDLQAKGKIVAMVGDGINDAPALATADIGIAIGTGTDVAIESSHITLLGDNLNNIVQAIRISKKTMVNIKQNFFWAFAYNTIGIPIAALGFLAPWIAGAAMAFSSISVVLNALRLQRMKL